MSGPMSEDVRLYARVLSMTDSVIVLEYVVDNASSGDVLVCNRLYSGRTPNGVYVIDPNVVYVSIEPGPRPNVTKRVPERGDDVNVEYPIQPVATLLRPGERFGEQFTMTLPLAPVDAYHPLRARPTAATVPSKGLTVSLGWFARKDLDDPLVVDVDTTAGRLPLVKASWVAQSIAQVELDVSVPVLAPAPTGVLTRQCPRCGAANAGEQDACLRCATPLTPPTAPAGLGWRPTHRVPQGGLQSYVTPGGAPSTALDGGLPVQVVERLGDWAHVVAWTGWSGWVDARRLVAAES